MRTEHAVVVRRLLAFSLDWVVMAAWGTLLFGAVTIATGGDPPRPSGPWTAQGIGFLTMTLPVVLYFALSESSAWRGSLGKRALGLAVSQETGGRLPFGRALLRSSVKLAPWEIGHLVAQQAAFSGEGGFSGWVWGPVALAFLGPAWWLGALAARGRTPYDRWSRSRVGRSPR